MEDKIICLVGASGSGKTTLAKELEKSGYNIIHSYTDREPREPNEWGHTFIKKTDIPMMKDVIAYRVIYGDRYYALRHQYQEKRTSIYIVDPQGAEQVKENVKDAEVITIFLMSEEVLRLRRMSADRDIEQCHNRIFDDREIFKTCKCDYVVDANREVEEVLSDVVEIIC